ncbi:TolB family protein [Criblamydia sequanensis]|uniref:Protein TolB homolog n=1 Tax=Candidatus Criblamydia sequanensis CRIB-18 TaxID=1437425 RepID=A0A090E454_9BACT|nr:DPP IV N-terminal domain-containing protein [Criblamydia sequanensis]CDR35254.1 Conserved hypothetical protein [Criblamydia sequanensis CRIB-18]
MWNFFWAFFISLIFEFSCLTDEPYLKNIHQITFDEMGFERAGEAYFSPDDSTILFQAIPKGKKEYQIYRMNLMDGLPLMVSTGKGSCTCAYFHPTQEKIIFASSHSDPMEFREEEAHESYKWHLTPYMNIYEANLDGSDLKALTGGEAYHAECAYSPDGTKIVYASNESGSMNIYVMDADGYNAKAITHTEGIYNGGPFFSPDGKKIIFRADRMRPDYLQIYMIDLETLEEELLTDNEAINWAPYWHPDGDKIAFTTSLHGHHRYEIYLLELATGRMQRLTDYPSFDGLPVFSHDGKKLMWTSKRSPNRSCQIYIADFINPFES